MKGILRFITSREWRGHKRRLFFESIFQELRDDRGKFSGIVAGDSWFQNICHDLAVAYDFYPLDDKYSMDLDYYIRLKTFQKFSSLKVEIRRKSSLITMLLLRRGKYEIVVNGVEDGRSFDFSYEVFYPSK